MDAITPRPSVDGADPRQRRTAGRRRRMDRVRLARAGKAWPFFGARVSVTSSTGSRAQGQRERFAERDGRRCRRRRPMTMDPDSCARDGRINRRVASTSVRGGVRAAIRKPMPSASEISDEPP